MEQIWQLDKQILEMIFQNLHNGYTDKIFPVITYMGEYGVFWITLALVLIFFVKTRRCGISMLCALLMGVVVGELIIKHLVMRDRPFIADEALQQFLLIAPPSGYSFPSGHTCSSFAASMSIFFENKKWGIPAVLLACAIAFSRLFLMVHYPTDVFCGMCLGILCAVAARILYGKYGQKATDWVCARFAREKA